MRISDWSSDVCSSDLTIPVAAAGPMTLLMPQWLPGNHAPRGQIEKLTGLTFTADGKPLAWKRDPLNVFGFVIDVPQGVKQVVASFQFLSATPSNQGRDRKSVV